MIGLITISYFLLGTETYSSCRMFEPNALVTSYYWMHVHSIPDRGLRSEFEFQLRYSVYLFDSIDVYYFEQCSVIYEDKCNVLEFRFSVY